MCGKECPSSITYFLKVLRREESYAPQKKYYKFNKSSSVSSVSYVRKINKIKIVRYIVKQKLIRSRLRTVRTRVEERKVRKQCTKVVRIMMIHTEGFYIDI